jgi:hypothetical protein
VARAFYALSSWSEKILPSNEPVQKIERCDENSFTTKNEYLGDSF